jgi:hypothetical protein
MLGSGFNSQLVPNPNAAGASQQQQPSESMQPIGGLPNPEHTRMWMQMQQQINQQRTTSAGDIVGSQVTLNSSFVASLSLFLSLSYPFFLPRFPPSRCTTSRPPIIFPFSSPDTALRPTLAFSSLGFAYVSSGFCYVSSHPPPSSTNGLVNNQLISLSFRWSVSNSYSVHPFPWAPALVCSITTCSANSKTTELSTR